MTRSIAERERARVKKQRQRERRREAARREAAAEAERLDRETVLRREREEGLAPAIMREAVLAPGPRGGPRRPPDGRDGPIGAQGADRAPARMLVGPRVQIVDGRPVRACGMGIDTDRIGKLARDSKAITDAHLRAARRLQLDWNEVGAGLGVGAVDYLRAGGAGDGTGGHLAMLAQVAARARLDAALAHLGAFVPAIARVVLDCLPLSVWAAEAGKQPVEAIAWIAAGLDRLRTFYWPPRPDGGRSPRPLTFGPAREAYVTDLADMSIEG